MQAIPTIYIEKRTPTKKSLYPVKLRITHNRKRRYFSLKQYLPEEWMYLSEYDFNNRIMIRSPRGNYRDIKERFDKILDKAKNVIDKMETFSFNRFEEEFFSKQKEWDSVFHAFQSHIETLENEGRPVYTQSFHNCFYNVKEFTKSKDLTFHDITPGWLKNFENWLLKNGKSKGTVGVYTRTLRRLFNIAIKEHKVKADYPFKNYTPQAAIANKRALTPQQIGLIMNYEAPEGGGRQFAKDIFLFSFFANGMNIGDIFRLKYSNIQGSEIVFVREKTKGKRTEKKIHVPYIETLQNIVERWGQKAINNNVYIFPVLNDNLNETEKRKRIKDKISNLNKRLKTIATDLELGHLSTVYARHSCATIMKNSGASTEYIQEMLGHSSVNVTQNYLSSFEAETRHKNARKLENMIKNQDIS